MDADRAGRIKTLLRKKVEWDFLFRVALQHGITPLLYWHLNAVCPDTVPAPMLHQLRNHFDANAKHNLLLMGELLKLLDQFQKNGISAISFKGPFLAKEIYGNLALRVFCDLDILVHKEDLDKTKELLVSKGYKPCFSYTRAQEVAHLESGHAYTFVRGDGQVHVDLHWRITQSQYFFAIDPESLWARSELVAVAGKSIRKPASEDLLLILCLHGAKHCWERLGWICDVAEIIASDRKIDLPSVLVRADRIRSRRVLLLGLLLARDLLGATLPKKIVERINVDQKLKTTARQVFRHLFSQQPALLREVRRGYLYLKMREGLRHKMPYFFYSLRKTMTPNRKDEELLPLPAILAPLHYFFRPLRLLATFAWLGIKNMPSANSRNR
jgi:hypothetical protein